MSAKNNNKFKDDDFNLAVMTSFLLYVSTKLSQPFKNLIYTSKSVADKVFLLRCVFGYI